MADEIVQIADGFWNIRGAFRVFGLLNIGTQSSLVRLAGGRYALLDSYTLKGDPRDEVMARTDGGDALDAIINLHPFHTVHVKAVAAMFPNAKLYGTSRHHAVAPDLRWEPERTETAAFAALFADDLDLTVPKGVDFVPSNENLHFASVLAIHKATETLHVDDTLNWIPIPFVKGLAFHPTLNKVLERRPGAAADFRAWAEAFADRCETVRHVCTAHTKLAPVSGDPPGGIAQRVRAALTKVDKVLRKHEAAHPAQ
ncbi:MAG: hypothetical protein CSA66_06130 [Proteobacteria bacterium]|nr:MAG: hypothetical protein CSA66_06130 [Pseudomonadota bacterium]